MVSADCKSFCLSWFLSLQVGRKSSKLQEVSGKHEVFPNRKNLSRRDLLKIAGLGICLPFTGGLQSLSAASPEEQHTKAAPPPTQTFLSPADDELLEELEKADFQYFWEQANPQTGMVKDRCNVRIK